jgi:hypothetical protein
MRNYDVVFGYTAEALEHNVELKMPEWQCQGGVSLSEGGYMQAIVKEGKRDYLKWVKGVAPMENAHA